MAWMRVDPTNVDAKAEQPGAFSLQRRLTAARGPLTKRTAASIINRLLYLVGEDPRQPIPMEVNSTSGAMAEVLGIVRVMDRISCPVATFCRGEVRGAAVLIAAHGLKGFRVAAPDCRFSFATTSGPADKEALAAALTALPLKPGASAQPEFLRWLATGEDFSPDQALLVGLIDLVSPKPVFPTAQAG